MKGVPGSRAVQAGEQALSTHPLLSGTWARFGPLVGQDYWLPAAPPSHSPVRYVKARVNVNQALPVRTGNSILKSL